MIFLDTAWVELEKVDWALYQTTSTGSIVCSHALLCIGEANPNMKKSIFPYGCEVSILEEDSKQELIRGKVELLHSHPQSMASIELHGPTLLSPGGALRSSEDRNEIYAIEGFPEVVNHALIGVLMITSRDLNSIDWQSVNDSINPGLIGALKSWSMTDDHYKRLVRDIFSIVGNAIARLSLSKQ